MEISGALLACTLLFLSSSRRADGAAAKSSSSSSSIVHIDALMPEKKVEHEEAYLCTSVQLPERPLKLVGVEPLSSQEVVHHMLLFGERLP
jgi:hypothetical protein